MSKWIVPNVDDVMKEKVKEISSNFNMHPKVAEVLVTRGMDTIDKVDKFINFTEDDIPDSNLILDFAKATNRIASAINMGENIVIYADYDADGTCACSVLLRGIKNLGGNVSYFTNDRFKQGFGMKVDGVKSLLKENSNVDLIITVDNGIVAFDAADYIENLGIDLIITDHHEPSPDGLLPTALAIVDVKRDGDTYPFKEICGTTVAYKIVEAVTESLGKSTEAVEDLLPLVALGTVADCVSMTEENRFFVKKGLDKMQEEKIIAFKYLRQLFKIKDLNEETCGFYYGPLINASSRLIGNAMKPIALFTTDDEDLADKLSTELYEVNNERKETTELQLELVSSKIASENKENDKVIVLYDPGFHEGIVGILAGRVTELYRCPSIVFTQEVNGTLKGSARSVEGFNIKEALDELSSLTIQSGGHAMAAGISIELENLDAFTKELNELAKKANFMATDDSKLIEISLPTAEEVADITLIQGIKDVLRPFGTDWPSVNSRIERFEVEETRILKDVHLKLTRNTEDSSVSILWFNVGAEYYENMGKPQIVEVIGNIDINVFKGNVSFQVILNDPDNLREVK